jgi:outer membrane protein assembly factor BamB
VFELLWSETAGNPPTLAYRPKEIGGTALSTELGTVYVAARSGALECRDLNSGELRWSVDAGEDLYSPPVVAGTDLFLGLSDGRIVNYDARTGAERWSYRGGSAFHTEIVADGDLVAAISASNSLHIISRETGASIARHTQTRPTDLVMLGTAPVTFTDDALYAGFSDGRLGAFTRQGELLWLSNLAGTHRRLIDVDTRPLVVGDIVVAASFTGGVYGVRVSDGSVVWHVEQRAARSPLLAPNGLILSVGSGGLIYWIDPTDGYVVGQLEVEAETLTAPVMLTESLVAVGSDSFGVYVIDASVPWIYGRFESGSGFSTPPAAAGSLMSVLSDGGHVYALRVSTRPFR